MTSYLNAMLNSEKTEMIGNLRRNLVLSLIHIIVNRSTKHPQKLMLLVIFNQIQNLNKNCDYLLISKKIIKG